MTPASGLAAQSWTDVRSDFPYASECVYLNTAAAGLSWTGQGAAAAAFYDDAKRYGYNGMDRWRVSLAAARAKLAPLLGATEDELRFVASTTEGLYLVTGAIRWRRGDQIVLAADEFPSVVLACEAAERQGVVLRRVAVPSEGEREAALIDAIAAKTRLVAVSHVHWATGTRLDLARLSAACHDRHAMLMVDGVQALGASPANAGGADFYCASVFKWLLSGFGLAVLMVRDRARADLSPRVRGYNNPPPSTDLQYAHTNYPGLAALAATLDYLELRVGWDRVFERVAELTELLHDALGRRGLTVVTPRDARAGIVSCVSDDASRIRDELAHEAIFVEARNGLIRVSPHFYNTPEDIEAVVDALGRAT